MSYLFFYLRSFVRSVTMDKWKDIELEKMKAGGNGKFRLFLELQEDYDSNWNLQEKYNSRAAALFRDKVSCAAQKVFSVSMLKQNNIHKALHARLNLNWFLLHLSADICWIRSL